MVCNVALLQCVEPVDDSAVGDYGLSGAGFTAGNRANIRRGE